MKQCLLVLAFSSLFIRSSAQEAQQDIFEISGYAATDVGYHFNQVNPDWFDVMRPTQLPAYKNQYGSDKSFYSSVRQSALVFRSSQQTRLGTLHTLFAFDFIGVGPDVGQTSFHILYAYAELGKIGAGHNWSLFCDFDGYPLIVEYWGPVGLSLCKNVQVRYIPFNKKNRLAIAIERPGGTADQGIYRDRVELEDVRPVFSLPDISAEFRMRRKWGYVELAGIVRKIEWEDLGQQPYDFSGEAIGWGFNLSTNIKIGQKTMFLGQSILGEGIENYMNDAPTDISIKKDFENTNSPIKGVALPLYSYSAYFNHRWNKLFSSMIGYSGIVIDNTNGQSPDAFHKGNYASTNLLYYPVSNLTAGIELQWISRENFTDGWDVSATKIQISFRYNFKEEIKTRKE